MRTLKTLLAIAVLAILVFASLTSCKKQINGCTDANALNFNASATQNDNSCIAKINGCTDLQAVNYNNLANVNCCCTYTGNVTFWTPTNLGSAIGVTITINSMEHIRYITKYYSGSFPGCDAPGCAIFKNIPSGNWPYFAQNSAGNYWSGYINIYANQCVNLSLN